MNKIYFKGPSLAKSALIFIIFLILSISVFIFIHISFSEMTLFAKETDKKADIDPDADIYWKKLSDFLTNDFAIDPVNPANIYIATDFPTAVAYSRDFGATWTTKLDDFGDGHTIAIDPVEPNYIYVGVTGGAIYRSDDSGEAWRRVDGSISNGKHLSELFVHPITPTLVLAGSTTGLPEVYRSDDRGETWSAIPLVSNPTNKEVKQIVSHPTIPNRIFSVVKNEGILVSEDFGLTWTNSGIDAADAIAIDANNPDIIYRLDCHPYRSSDGGASWSLLPSPEPCYQGIHLDPQDSNIVYLTSQFRRVTRSLDSGQNWQILVNELFSSPLSSSFAIDPVNTEKLYVGQGVFTSIYLTDKVNLPVILR